MHCLSTLVVNDSRFMSTLVLAFNVLHYCIQCVLLLVLANDLMSVASVQYAVCVVSLRFSGTCGGEWEQRLDLDLVQISM